MSRSSRVRLVALLATFASLPVLYTSGQEAAAAAESGSAVTRHGQGRFSDLAVTVSQTTHLRNQVVEVSWSGFQQTTELTGDFRTDYLQIMQCWGDEAEPKREKCQFGGLLTDSRGGNWTATRQTSYFDDLVDPEETYLKEPGTVSPARVPFEAVNGKVTSDVRNEFYDAYSTNEIPFARSAADGTGREYFEMQTAREAPGLGCGERLADGPRACWLVVVPRDETEVNGLAVEETTERKLVSSPLSASNWENALAFRMQFEPIGLACPFGAAERRLLGNEMVAEAVSRWQPELCGETGAIFGYSQIGDDLARSQVLGDSPWLSMVGGPVDPDRVADGRQLSYAPLTVSGLGVAFNFDRQPLLDAPEAVQQTRGSRIGDMRLNARLVAKLLTQSYRLASLGPADLLAGNPAQLTDDPEFKKLNPGFDALFFQGIVTIANPLGLSDANRSIWAWVGSDPGARAFIAGKRDPWGAKVNPAYQAMSLDRADFPRSDPYCQSFLDGRSDLCPLDYLAYAADFHDAGRAAARGDTLSRTTWDMTGNPPTWKKSPPQLSGQRSVLALVDTATAARYELPLARLENAAGEYVAADAGSMTAAVKAMREGDVPGVLESDPASKAKRAYPLTTVSYAVTAPRLLTKAEAKDYAGFLTYAATKGQKPGVAPGDLPAGYLPLPEGLRKQALAAADLVAKRGGPEPTPTPTPTPTPDGSGTGTPGGSGGADGPSSMPGPKPGAKPAAVAAPAIDTPVTAVSTTPATPVGNARFLLLAAVALGALGALVRPFGLLVVRWRRSAAP